MEVTKSYLDSIIEEVCTSEDIQISDIPKVEIYMEQLLSFLNDRLEPLKKDADKALTKTMINSYIKEGIVIQPRNKKYSKNHIILLILIYHLKNTISINEIHSLFAPILNDINTREDDIISIEDIYGAFLDLKKDQYDEVSSHYNEKVQLIQNKILNIEDPTNKDKAAMFLTILMLIAQANAAKRIAEKLIAKCFTEDASGNDK